MRLFLDANVIFAACWKPEGGVGKLFILASLELIQLFTSTYALDEVRKNLQNKKPTAIGDLEAFLRLMTVVSEPELSWIERAEATGLALKDTPVLAAALQHELDILVTGDLKHFETLMGKAEIGIRVLTPAQTIAEIVKQL